MWCASAVREWEFVKLLFQNLLEQEVFHQSLFACCLEIVIYSYNSQRTFPWLLDALSVEPYYFYKVIEVIVKVEDQLSRNMVKHLNMVSSVWWPVTVALKYFIHFINNQVWSMECDQFTVWSCAWFSCHDTEDTTISPGMCKWNVWPSRQNNRFSKTLYSQYVPHAYRLPTKLSRVCVCPIVMKCWNVYLWQ